MDRSLEALWQVAENSDMRILDLEGEVEDLKDRVSELEQGIAAFAAALSNLVALAPLTPDQPAPPSGEGFVHSPSPSFCPGGQGGCGVPCECLPEVR